MQRIDKPMKGKIESTPHASSSKRAAPKGSVGSSGGHTKPAKKRKQADPSPHHVAMLGLDNCLARITKTLAHCELEVARLQSRVEVLYDELQDAQQEQLRLSTVDIDADNDEEGALRLQAAVQKCDTEIRRCQAALIGPGNMLVVAKLRRTTTQNWQRVADLGLPPFDMRHEQSAAVLMHGRHFKRDLSELMPQLSHAASNAIHIVNYWAGSSLMPKLQGYCAQLGLAAVTTADSAHAQHSATCASVAAKMASLLFLSETRGLEWHGTQGTRAAVECWREGNDLIRANGQPQFTNGDGSSHLGPSHIETSSLQSQW